MIKEIGIQNFKSIENLKLPLGRFNVFIGANGGGKSNILEAITFGAAAMSANLTNEFLATRGIRMTEPNLMFSAFDSKNKAIQLHFNSKEDKNITFHIFNEHNNWQIAPIIDEKISNIIHEHEFAQNTKIVGGNLHFSNAIFTQKEKLTNDFFNAYKDFLEFSSKKINDYNKQNQLQNFIIFSPENYFLRNVFDENQIKPLGIRGEGLFRHLATIGYKKPAIFDEIKESLQFIEWFDDLEFDMTSDGYFTGRIKIKDIYLENGIKYFDARSANEGFLYLLFYLTLFISPETPQFFAIDNIDNALNPKLANDLMQLLAKLALKYDKQVIFTTHNPAILDGLNLNDDEQRLFVISRNALGHTKALRIEKKIPLNNTTTKLSEQFLRGYIGGLNF